MVHSVWIESREKTCLQNLDGQKYCSLKQDVPNGDQIRQGALILVWGRQHLRALRTFFSLLAQALLNQRASHTSAVQLLSCVQLFATRWIAYARSPCPSPSLCHECPSLMSIESVMPSNHLILCHPLLLLLSILPSIRVFSNE